MNTSTDYVSVVIDNDGYAVISRAGQTPDDAESSARSALQSVPEPTTADAVHTYRAVYTYRVTYRHDDAQGWRTEIGRECVRESPYRPAFGIDPVAPVVGMPATVCIGTDTYAARVVDVIPARGRRRVAVFLALADDPADSSRYVPSHTQSGVWHSVHGCRRAYLGAARTYRDPTR